MIVVVKGRKDKKAVEKVVRDAEVKRIGKIDEIRDFCIFLLGKGESVNFEEGPTLKIVNVNKKRVRNCYLDEILKYIEIGKFRFLLDVRREEKEYIFGKKGFLEIIPGSDIYIIERNFLGIKLNSFPLVHHIHDGREYIYCGCLSYIFNRETLELKKVGEVEEMDGKRCWKNLLKSAEEKIEIVKEKIKGLDAIVTWSGGKDSTFLLYLAKKYCSSVFAVYVKTEDDKITEEYLEYIAKKLKIDYYVINASYIKERAKNKEYLESRLCARDKVQAIYKFLKENFRDFVVLVGDRISESISRFHRPEISFEEGFLHIRPIKYFSFAEIQAVFKKEGIKLHPYYYKGFWRIGCSFCPFLDKFERKTLGSMSK